MKANVTFRDFVLVNCKVSFVGNCIVCVDIPKNELSIHLLQGLYNTGVKMQEYSDYYEFTFNKDTITLSVLSV